MNVAGLPDRETLLVWMSAFLDGELPIAEEAILLEAMEADPELLAHFENLAAAYEPAAHTQTGLSEADARDLTQNILLAVAPAALPTGASSRDLTSDEHVLQWASMAADDALEESGAALLAQACESPEMAQKVAAFVGTQEKVSEFLVRWPEQEEMAAAVAPMGERVAEAIRTADARQMAWSATLDGELSAGDTLAIASEAEAREALAFARSAEAVGAALRAAIDDPAAERAGAAALQVIAAKAAQAADEKSARLAADARATAPQAPPRASGWRFLPLAGFATAALALTFWSSSPPPAAPPSQADGATRAAAEPPVAWEPLADNTAQVESLDSGSHVAAVFATDANQITVIWVAEPEEEPQTETGT